MKTKQTLTLLGSKKTTYPTKYTPSVLEAFDNKNPQNEQWVSFNCPEFTSLCPMTQQPDFAKIIINYIPGKKLVESKSLKLYLFSFRNHGDFHENCVQAICNDLFNLMNPCYLEVLGEFTPRGGISIHPFSARHNNQKKFQELYQTRLFNYRLN